MTDETAHAAKVHAIQIADALLADLYAGVIPKIGLDVIERYAADRFIGMPAPRPSLREMVDWTVCLVIEKAADLGELRGQRLVGRPARNAIYGSNEQAE